MVIKILQMVKRWEKPMNNAKKSWEKAIEWWKNFWKWALNALENTALSIWLTLLSVWAKWDQMVSNKRERREWITEKQRKEHEKKAKEHSKEAKVYIKKAWEKGKKAVIETRRAIKWGGKAIWYTVKWGYHLIDAWDKAIWDQIEKDQIEKWKKPWKIWELFRDNMVKLMLFLSLSGVLWNKMITKDKLPDGKEIVINDTVKENWTEIVESPEESVLTFEEKPYFQNPDFFDKDFKVTKDETYKDKWVILMRDAWMTFYIVQEWEKTKEKIREKLSSISEFSYLKDSLYNNKIMWFNVPDASLKKWLYIPIPLKTEDRHIDINAFKEYSRIALQEMKDDSHYWEKVKKLIEEYGEERVINIMTAFARCETATDQEKFSDPIWTAELHRREPRYKSFSFSYYHILMEKSADGKTPWPWLKARQNLWLTEWQCYHPINAWKLFLGYCFEKKPSNYDYFFKIGDLEEAKIKWWKYNGDSSYWKKLWANIQHIEEYNIPTQQNKHYNLHAQQNKHYKSGTKYIRQQNSHT